MDYKYLMPEYFKNFSCIGSECEDTCCKEWRISIDKETYKKYRKIRSEKFDPFKNNNIILGKDKFHTSSYAFFNLKNTENRTCPFLSNNMLCNIYINLGENYMPNTCRTYPRIDNKLDENVELSLTMSCPEACRVALLSEEPMAFVTTNKNMLSRSVDSKYFNFSFNSIKNIEKPEHTFFWDIRIASISILQNRKFDIKSRLFLLGLLYKKLDKYIKEENYEKIPDEIDKLSLLFQDINIDSLTKNIHVDQMTRLTIYFYFAKEIFVKKITLKEFKDEIINFMAMIKVDINTEEGNTDLENFRFIKEDIFQKLDLFLEKNQYIIENYLVNEFFRLLMPFGEDRTLWNCIITLSTNFAFIKLSLLARLVSDKELDRDYLLFSIQQISRHLIHDIYYRGKLENIYEKYSLESLGGIYTLIS